MKNLLFILIFLVSTLVAYCQPVIVTGGVTTPTDEQNTETDENRNLIKEAEISYTTANIDSTRNQLKTLCELNSVTFPAVDRLNYNKQTGNNITLRVANKNFDKFTKALFNEIKILKSKNIKITDVTDEINALNTTLEVKNSELESYNEQLEDAQQELEDTKAQAPSQESISDPEEYNRMQTVYQQKVHELELSISQIQTKISEMQNDIKKKEKELKVLSDKVEYGTIQITIQKI